MSTNKLDDLLNKLPNPKQNFPEMEEAVLQYWAEDNTFYTSLENRRGGEEWTFYDGPPFANGLPHYGHLLTGYAKDTFPRYQTMKGKYVPRVFGWDTHGLPAELEAMKQLGLTEKHQVEEMGVSVFNQAAKGSVLKYVDEWKEYVTRQGRWVDFDGGYKTLDLTYMESVVWAFKRLYDKGLAYEGYRVLPYCWKDQTPLSTHELNMDDDVYKVRNDVSVTATFPMYGAKADELGLTGVEALAWTTTPWTLPMNLALAVNPALHYVVVARGSSTKMSVPKQYLLAASLLKDNLAGLGYETEEEAKAAVTKSFTGADLEGVQYLPVWDYYKDTNKWGTENAWKFLLADYVTDASGTGVVHQAPAHGEDDQKTCEANGVPTFPSVDEGAKFLPEVTDFVGLNVFDAVKPVMKALKEKDRFFSQKDYNHEYPHCWRCKTPLVYKAVSSWFVKVTAFKDRMGELNQEVNWTPSNVQNGVFGNWVANARDWSVSRNRYWGSPVPVWKSDNPEYPRVDVYGSLKEMEADFGVEVSDLHRPFVDELTRPNPDDPTGRSTMRRVEDVLDVWFDSGSMPFAQMHYPFENVEEFEANHPSDFVVEYVGQTRGWFYVMHALSTALFDRPAFKNAVSHGVVLGSDGKKMSKSSGNYPDVNEVFNRDGSDAMRWFLMSSSVLRGGTLAVKEEAVTESMRAVMLPLWNSYYFYKLYLSGYNPVWQTDSEHYLDRYVFAKLQNLTVDMTAALEGFDSTLACSLLTDFMDMLNNWYVRRSRARFWDEDAEAFNTLYTVLETTTRLAAPLLPFLSEYVWKGVTGGRSVHLEDYPKAEEFPADEQLVETMDQVRKTSSVGLALRKKFNLRVRQPLTKVTLALPDSQNLEKFAFLLREELNVKEVNFVRLESPQAEEFKVSQGLKLNSATVGKRLGKEAQLVFKASRNGDWKKTDTGVEVAGVTLEEGEYEFFSESKDSTLALDFLPTGGFVVLDTLLTEALEAEGFSRDVVRAVQDARKNGGFLVSDRVKLRLEFSSEEDYTMMRKLDEKDWEKFASEVLATEYLLRHSDKEVSSYGTFTEFVKAGKYVNKGSFTVQLT
jgi:isoleucyl-tRNA synthetase